MPKKDFDKCGNCKGTGTVRREHFETRNGQRVRVAKQVKCNQCGGTGTRRS